MIDFFYIDPMSFDNLEEYDINVLSSFNYNEILFLGSTKFKRKEVINTKLIYNYNNKKGLIKVFSYFVSQIILLSLIYNFKPKVVHFQWFKIYSLDLFLLKFIRFFSSETKIIYTAHNILPHDSKDKFFNVFKNIYNTIDGIIVHDINTKLSLTKKFNINDSKVNVIPHGLLNIPVNNKKAENLLHNNKLDNKIVFSFIGKLNMYKGIDLLYDAWKSSKSINENLSLQLVVAGRGNVEYINKFKEFKNVTVVNRYLSNEEFISYLRLSDVILMPYREISQSGVLLTAINESKLVIVSNKGGLTEPFNIANIGWVLPKLNVKELQKAILKASVIEKRSTYIEVEEKMKLEEFYNWTNISKKTKLLYLTLSENNDEK